MRILIAEDEFIERKSMRKFIEEHFTDIHVVGEAANGRQAIEQALAVNPDVIFMDIKMPGIDGLEAIEHIYNRDASMKFIMVSAYDTFDYAKKAMRFGIKDYILKPGKKEEITKALLRMKRELETEQRQREEKVQSQEWMNERFIKGIMHYPVQHDVYDLQQNLFPDMQSGYFLVVMTDEGGLEKWHEMLKRKMNHPFILYEGDDFLVICVMASIALKKSDALQIAQECQVEQGQSSFIGIGLPCSTLENMPGSYHEAYTASLHLKLNGNRRYGFLHEDANPHKLAFMIDHICERVEKGNAKEAVWHYDENSHLFDVSDKENLYIKIKELLDVYKLSSPYQSLASMQADNDWHNFINVCAMKINNHHQSKQYMAQVQSYLHTHYHQSISLDDAAALIQLSPNYLSNLFKEEMGENFVDYLTRIRLQKARTLIQENSHSLKEISFMVGYKDPNYFSRVFKKYYGEAPSQFQQDIFYN